MELFRINCLTCHAKLAVRNPALIGQIMACPRCGSMVHIASPHAETTTEMSPTTTAPPTTVPATTATSPIELRFSGDFSLDHAPIDASAGPSTNVQTNDACASAKVDGAPLAEDSLVRWFAWGAVGAALGAATVGALLMRRGNQTDALHPVDNASLSSRTDAIESSHPPQTTVSSNIAVGVETVPPETVPPEAVHVETLESERVEAEKLAAETVEEKLVGNDANFAERLGEFVEAAPEPVMPSTEPDVPDSNLASSTTDADASTGASVRPPSPSPNEQVLTIDPLDLDPEGLDMAGLRRGSQMPDNRASADGGADAATSLGTSGGPQSDSPPALPQTSSDAMDDSMLSGPSLSKVPILLDSEGSPAGAPPDTAECLAQPLAGVAINKMPLSEFLVFATRLSGAPISADPMEIRLAGLAIDHKISLQSEETTVGEMLAAALSPLRLAAEPTSSQAIIRRQGLANQRDIVYPIGDLLNDDFSSEALVEVIRKFVAPASWESAEEASIASEKESLRVVHQERVQYETLFFLERLRLARGLPTKSRFPAALLPLAAPELAAQSQMGAPATFMFSQYTPLSEVFLFWQRELGMAVLVDWPALQETGLWPQSRVACRAEGQSWSAALDDLLTPLGLAWCIVDAGALRISSLSQMQREPVVAFYQFDAAKRADLASWQGRINAWAEQTRSEATPGVALAIDVPSGHLMVRHAAPVQRRIAAAVK